MHCDKSIQENISSPSTKQKSPRNLRAKPRPNEFKFEGIWSVSDFLEAESGTDLEEYVRLDMYIYTISIPI